MNRGGNSRGGRGNRGRGNDSPEVRLSKNLSSILRHNAGKEGIAIRPDGYVKVTDLLGHPKFRNATFEQVQQVVKMNEKQRFKLVFEELEPKEALISAVPVVPEAAAAEESIGEVAKEEELPPLNSDKGTWWIRANQGHSLQKVIDLELVEITDSSEYPTVMHGTNQTAWPVIAKLGLSRMNRNHIHLATGKVGEVTSGMRASARVMIHIDLETAMKDGFKFYRSDNGVVLCPGDERGFLPAKYFKQVEVKDGSKWKTLPVLKV
jgi:2'-phosphotransferase